MYIYIYMYIYIVCIHIYIYIYISIEIETIMASYGIHSFIQRRFWPVSERGFSSTRSGIVSFPDRGWGPSPAISFLTS